MKKKQQLPEGILEEFEEKPKRWIWHPYSYGFSLIMMVTSIFMSVAAHHYLLVICEFFSFEQIAIMTLRSIYGQ